MSGVQGLKTRIYIDGYNLYFGALKPTQYKWLDPIKLVTQQIIPRSAPKKFATCNPAPVHATFFTSKVIPAISFSKDAPLDQKTYHEALLSQYPENNFEIIEGYHTHNPVYSRKVDTSQPNRLHANCEQVKVWKIEEKQTDVNIAVSAMRDAFTDSELEHMIFVSNDTDLCGLLKYLSSMNKFTIGVVAPIYNGSNESRKASKGLEEVSDWMSHSIKSEELANSQLPLHITHSERHESTLKYALRKPLGWFGSNGLAEEIFDLLLSETKKRNSCYKWLEQEPLPQNSSELPDLPAPAIHLLDNEKDALLVKKHVEAYIAYKNQNK
jgi:6-hydroxy-3-succinoylpyridine 3-monooxygenase